MVELLSAVGIIILSYILLIKIGCNMLICLQFCFNTGIDVTKLGKWAVVTGSTDGIGKEYAFQLAKRGMDIVLISRNLQKLHNVATEIEKTFNVKTQTIVADFSDESSIYEQIRREVQGVDIGILVNNVGITNECAQYFDTHATDKEIQDMLRVNTTALTMMTRVILPGMVERHRGAIINLSSGLSLYPPPLMTLYASTKAYVNCFTQALREEYKHKGIIVQLVIPFQVATTMSRQPVSFLVPTAQHFVRSALNTVGSAAVTHGCFPHTLQAYIIDMIPTFIKDRYALTMMLEIRRQQEQELRLLYKTE